MIKRTHLAIGLAVALFFSTRVNEPLIFIPVVLVASLFPDIDSATSYFGRKIISKPVQMTTDHRGIVHSYTFAILLSAILAYFYPILALPFFMGYSFHLLADSFTTQGLKPFWPIKTVSKGPIVTGGRIEKTVYYTFILVDVVLVGTIAYALI